MVVQCVDGSDEQGCRTLALPTSYSKLVPPLVARPDSSHPSATVNVTLNIIRIGHIDEDLGQVRLQFETVLEWVEPRAKYQNLKLKTTLNSLTPEDSEQLWQPVLAFDPTMDVIEEDVLVAVVREGGFVRSPLEVAEEVEVFEGGENRLVARRVAWCTLLCTFHLHWYPFDSQVLP